MGLAIALGLVALVLIGLGAQREVSRAALVADARHHLSALNAAIARADAADQRTRMADLRRDSAITQVQHLAQQLATIRVKFPEAVPDERVFETAEAALPYSSELDRFLDGLLSDEARVIVEGQIESMRARNMSDEQIFPIIAEGESI